MTTKANRSKASQRIEKAKAAYNLAEGKTDSLLIRLIDSKYTLAVVLVVCGVTLWAVL